MIVTVRSTAPAAGTGSGAAGTAAGDSRQWLILAVICVAYLMVTLDVTVMTLALPSAQDDLGFTNVDRQWIVTAYALSFGSLLLVGGRLADLIGRNDHRGQRCADAAVRPQADGHRRPAAQRGRHGLADQDRRGFGLRVGPARADHGGRCRHGPHLRCGAPHRYLWCGTTRRGDSLRERQHRAAAWRRDRHRAARYDRGQRHRRLPGEPRARAASTAAGPPRDDPRLHHGVLVVRRIFAAGAVICGTLLRRGPLPLHGGAPA